MTELIRKQIVQYDMIRPGDLVVAGLSGGEDSVCLLSVLKKLSEEMGFSLAALHVHHGIRGEDADRDAEFSRQLCADWGIFCEVSRADVPAAAAFRKQSVEEAARQERYDRLERFRQRLGAQRIAVAHHREDNAETVLWNLFRGSGLRGLSGMEPVNGYVIRPMLAVSKEDIHRYMQENGLPWRLDKSNEEEHYTRNRIRRRILAYAGENINRQAAKHICQAAKTAAQADAYLRRQADCWLEQHAKTAEAFSQAENPEKKSETGLKKISLPVHTLREEAELLQTYILREACRQCGSLTDLSVRHVEAISDLLKERPGACAGRCLSLPGGLAARRLYDELIFEKKTERTAQRPAGVQPKEGKAETKQAKSKPPVYAGEEVRINAPALSGEPFLVQIGQHSFSLRLQPFDKSQKIPTNQYTKWINYDKLEGSFVFRTRRTGDYILLPGGKKKTVKSYMIDQKIPAGDRDRIVLLAQGSHVLWIVGYRLSEAARLLEDTRQILQITEEKKDGKDSCVDCGG